MENPAAWTEVEKTIDESIREWNSNQEKMITGYSLPATIAEALRAKGFLAPRS